jgi:hypothetical protein
MSDQHKPDESDFGCSPMGASGHGTGAEHKDNDTLTVEQARQLLAIEAPKRFDIDTSKPYSVLIRSSGQGDYRFVIDIEGYTSYSIHRGGVWRNISRSERDVFRKALGGLLQKTFKPKS